MVDLLEIIAKQFGAKFTSAVAFLANLSLLVDTTASTLEALDLIGNGLHSALKKSIFRLENVAADSGRLLLRFLALNSHTRHPNLSGIGLRVHHHGLHL